MPAVVPPSYEWTRPTDGVKIVWRPLKTSAELQILAVYRSEANRHLQPYARLAARIVSVGGEKKDSYGPNDFGEWEQFDTDSFADEVSLKEAERTAALSHKSPDDARAALDAAADQAMAALAQLQGAIALVRALAHANPPQ